MPPTSSRLYNFKLGESSTSALTREAEVMHVRSTLYSRSTIEAAASSGNSGLQEKTVIFIVVGVVCLLVILVGFYFVSRPRATSDAVPSVHSSQPQHSPLTSPSSPPCQRDTGTRWKVWKIWRHTSITEPPITPTAPVSQVAPAPAAITDPSRIIHTRSGSKTHPTPVSRPSQARRVTSLSVTTSFSHSHITDEALNDFRLSAYDLDGDLEAEMLNSAREGVWQGHVLAIGDGCESMGTEEGEQTRGNASLTVGGSAEGYVPPIHTIQSRGEDYENLGACQSVTFGKKGMEGDVVEVDEVVIVRQVSQ